MPLQELLLDRGIALVLNVKRDLLDRIARSTDAEVRWEWWQRWQGCVRQASGGGVNSHSLPPHLQVVPSLAQLSAHSLGFCKEFEVDSLSPGPSLQLGTAALLARTSAVNGSSSASPTAAQAALEQVQRTGRGVRCTCYNPGADDR